MKTITDRDAQVIERVRGELLTGQTFRYVDASCTSADQMNYDPPISAYTYGAALQAFGTFARLHGDWGSAVVTAMLPGLSTGMGRFLNSARIARRAGEFVVAGWHDFQSATGPEPGRPSSHQHPTTERQAVLVNLLLQEVRVALGEHNATLGWVLSALVEEHAINLKSSGFAALAARQAA